jgi:hypothetical protein
VLSLCKSVRSQHHTLSKFGRKGSMRLSEISHVWDGEGQDVKCPTNIRNRMVTDSKVTGCKWMVEVQFHVRHFFHHFWNDFYRTVIGDSSRQGKKKPAMCRLPHNSRPSTAEVKNRRSPVKQGVKKVRVGRWEIYHLHIYFI